MSEQYTKDVPFEIFDEELIAAIRFTYVPEERETGPTYSCGGTPGHPAGVEDVEVVSVRYPKPAADAPPLVVPEWLADIIVSKVDYDDLLEAVPDGPDPDDARDRQIDDEMTERANRRSGFRAGDLGD